MAREVAERFRASLESRIDDRCPEGQPESSAYFDAGGSRKSQLQNDDWREFDNWALL